MARGGWANPPPVIVLFGDEDFLCQRELRKALAAAHATGRVVERVDGSDNSALNEAIEPMFGEQTLVVVSNPGKADPEILTDHLEAGDNTISVLLHQKGKIRKGSKLDKVVSSLKKQHRIEFSRPSQNHKVEDYAVKFVVLEAERLGVTISTDLAEALVRKVGTNLGVLHFELLKVSAYLSFNEGGSQVTAEALKATMVQMGETTLNPLSTALGRASTRLVLREMNTIRQNSSDPEGGLTLKVCAWLSRSATTWLHAAALEADGAGEAEAASRVSLHPYVYGRFVRPVAKRWGKARLTELVKKIAKAEASVKAGHVAPWIALECALAASCRSVSDRG